MNPYPPIVLVAAFSGWCLWRRYREGHLLAPASGLHVQILIFFGLGGLAFVGFQNSDPLLAPEEVKHYAALCCWPLALGYVAAVVLERRIFRPAPREEPVLTEAGILTPGAVSLLALLGFGGYVLEGRINVPGLQSVPSYFKILFFPGLFLSLTSTLSHRTISKQVESLIIVLASALALFTPWRSVLVLAISTILLAFALTRPSWLVPAYLLGVVSILVLVPFQNLKKADFSAFRRQPVAVLRESLSMPLAERLAQVEELARGRLDYVREMSYVQRALETSMPPRNGQTYVNIVSQLVPRILWHNKPEMAHWAGFDLPREIGLLHKEDEYTSWAVDMFAEATYNFGIWCLLWFVPLIFLIARGIENLIVKLYSAPQAVLLADVAFFFFFLDITTVIFAASEAIALLLVVKVVDHSMTFLERQKPQATAPAFKRSRRRRAKAEQLPAAEP